MQKGLVIEYYMSPLCETYLYQNVSQRVHITLQHVTHRLDINRYHIISTTENLLMLLNSQQVPFAFFISLSEFLKIVL